MSERKDKHSLLEPNFGRNSLRDNSFNILITVDFIQISNLRT